MRVLRIALRLFLALGPFTLGLHVTLGLLTLGLSIPLTPVVATAISIASSAAFAMIAPAPLITVLA